LVPQSPRVRHPGQLDAGPFAADIASFRLHLAAENKAAGTIRIYTDAARWFAASHLLAETDRTRWEQVDAADVRRWLVWLLGRYSEAYAYQQFRSLQQFFRWLAVEEDLPSPMAKLRPPKVVDKPVPFFSSVELSKAREIRVRGKGGRDRAVRIGHEAARRLDRYLRVRAGHGLAYRPELWLGVNGRGPLDRSGIYQLVVRRGEECGVRLYPHRFGNRC
jgi:site-specific recombinase XerD